MNPADRRRRATLAAPVTAPLTMAAVFGLLRRRLPPHAAYNAGVAVYWAGWCGVFSPWVLFEDRGADVTNSLVQRAARRILYWASGSAAIHRAPGPRAIERKQ